MNGDMTIPLQFASLYDGQEVFVWSDGLLGQAGHDSFSKTILQGTLEGRRGHGQHRKCWMDNVREWTSLPV